MRRTPPLLAAALVALPLIAAGPGSLRAGDPLADPGRARHEDHDHDAAPVADEPIVTQQGPIVFAPAGQSTDRFEAVTEAQRVDVLAHDGVALHARVYRPDTASDPSWRTPVILVHSPYYDGMTQGDQSRSLDLVEFFTPKGYTVVLSDVRGTGNSGGCAEQDGPNQALDFATLVEYFAAQPWSNGKVGSYGKSYDAETQNAGAVFAPAGLATMVTVAGIAGLYDVAFFDGVPLGANGLVSAAVYVPYGADLPGEQSALVRYPERFACQPANFLGPADLTGDMTTYWQEREFRRAVTRIPTDVSVLHVHGLNDPIVTPIAIDGWYDQLPGFKRAIWGQWEHKYPYDAASMWARDDWYPTIHAWFDQFLLDLDTGVPAWPPVQVQDDRNVWRAVAGLSTMGDSVALTLGNATLESNTEAGQAGATFAVGEDAPAEWSTAAFDDDVHLTGRAVLDATITLDRPDAHFAIVLEEVTSSGQVRALTQGWLSAMHRNGLTAGELVPMGESIAYSIRTYPFDTWLSAGSTLRLRLSGEEGDGLPAGTRWSGEVLVDGTSTLTIQVETQACGIEVAQVSEPMDDVADCTGGIPRVD